MTTAKRGRPKTAKGERSISVRITLHPDEHKKISKAAKKAKVKVVPFMRDAALEKS